jgi:Domain of unknown function (DUF4267)
MTNRPSSEGLRETEPSAWLVWSLAGIFVGLGLLFLFAPRAGAALFGLPAPEGMSLGYMAAIGLRDLAFGLYLLILSRVSTRRVLGLIFGTTMLIPIGDVVIVAAERGFDSPGHLLLHGASAAAMAAASVWLLRQAARDKTSIAE